MAQQVVKRYRLLKNAPNAKKDTIVTYDHEYGMYSYSGISGQLSDPMFYKEEVEGNPDWFEEVKDAPFECGGFEINRPTTKSQRFLMHCFYANEIPAEKVPAIRKAIEDIVNGVDDAAKKFEEAANKEQIEMFNKWIAETPLQRGRTYLDSEIGQLQREAFFAGFLGSKMSFICKVIT